MSRKKLGPVGVKLSNKSSLTIGPIKWKRGLVPVKNLILETLQTPSVKKGLARVLRTLVEGEDSILANLEKIKDEDVTKAGLRALGQLFAGDNLEEIANLIPEALYEISNRWDELTEILIYGCAEPDETTMVVPKIDFEDMSLDDITKLRDAVNAQNNWAEIWGTEKNSIVDVFGKMLNLSTSTGEKEESNPDGGQVGTASSLATALL